MKIIKPSHEILTPIHGEHGRNMLKIIEAAARTCYKSEGCATETSAGPFVEKIAGVKKHYSVIEHCSVSVRLICDRGVSHEIVRHRLAAYSQESTRYCNYAKDKFGTEITVIRPFFWDGQPEKLAAWERACLAAEKEYLALLELGATPQEARSVLPNSLKTELFMTANLREWRHVFKMRCSEQAHPQMRELMVPLLAKFSLHLPELFSTLG